MGERAEAAVGHQDIAGREQREDPGDARHVMRPQRRRDDLQQQPGAGVEQRQDVGHREAAALGLVAGLAEVGLQRGGVGHGERRAVDQEGAMAAPAADRLGVGDQGLDHVAEQGLEDGQGEPATGLAEGGGGEGAAGQQRDVGQGGVAVEDLDEEPVDDGRRGQEAARAPGVSGGAAGGVDEVVPELGGEVLSEGVEGGRNPAMHRGASCAMVVGKNTMVHGGSVFLKT